jgi:ubiquinone/menaquinone biosynthesis C-methylase UbiE
MPVKRVPLAQEPISGAEVVERYDRYAATYMAPEYRYFVRKILHTGIRSGRVLDIGTGSGRLAIELAKARDCNFNIVGLDISQGMLQRARENARQAGVENKIDFVPATGTDLPFSDKSFDLVISYASLHHWRYPVKVFKEIDRVARENGRIIIRDNKRIYGNPFLGAAVWSIRLFMDKQYRSLWPKAISASYTVPEAKAVLHEAGLKNYRVYSDFVHLDLCIEIPGRN